MLSRVIYGARISLLVGFVAVGLATLIGVLVGAAGYSGGVVDTVLMRLVDLMLCFPTLFLILAVIAVLAPSIWNIMVVIGVTGWMGVARLVRAVDEIVAGAKSGAVHLDILTQSDVLPLSLQRNAVSERVRAGTASQHGTAYDSLSSPPLKFV